VTKFILLLLSLVSLAFCKVNKNEIGLVFGIPDMINVKYTHHFSALYLGINSGFNPSDTIFIPGLYIGHKLWECNRMFCSIEFVYSYWPKMEYLLSTGSNDIETDWMHFGLRPTICYDMYRYRIGLGIGIDWIQKIRRPKTPGILDNYDILPCVMISSSYLF